jgi:hypothetical protein
LCEHVGSLFDYVDRHYNHGDNTYPAQSATSLRQWSVFLWIPIIPAL